MLAFTVAFVAVLAAVAVYAFRWDTFAPIYGQIVRLKSIFLGLFVFISAAFLLSSGVGPYIFVGGIILFFGVINLFYEDFFGVDLLSSAADSIIGLFR